MNFRGLFSAVLFLMGIVAPQTGETHPLGNFSINHFSEIRIGKVAVTVHYVIDMAEIPTFQEIQETHIVPAAADPSLHAYLKRKAEDLGQGLVLEVNGQRLVLETASKEIIFPPGAGGLPTMKIGILYRAKLGGNSASRDSRLYYHDANYAGRAGWKEIIAVPEPGITIENSSVPKFDRSQRLSDYPTDMLNSPPQQLEAHLYFSGATGVAPVASARESLPAGTTKDGSAARRPFKKAQENSADPAKKPAANETSKNEAIISDDASGERPLSNIRLQPKSQATTPLTSFTEVIATKQMSMGIVLTALVIALGLGALHALEPGHGKTLVAAYLVGSRGTMKHACLLGIIVTGAHTAGVYMVGAVTLYASRYVVPERLYPWLGVVSGVMIAGLGLILLVRRYSGKSRPLISGQHHAPHLRHSDHHHHIHEHRHHTRQHHRDDDGQREVSLRELLALGISGGIVPCPAALVVLLSAVAMQRIGLGLLLIVAFSAGLAAVLVAIGILVVYARQSLSGFQTEGPVVTRWLPLTSSAVIFVFGIALTLKALQGAGIV